MGNSDGCRRAPAHLLKGAATAALVLGVLPALSTLVLYVPPAQAFTGGASWAQQTPAASPSDLAGAAMAYDPAIGEMVLFGGVSDGQVSDSTYTYNGTAWILQSPAATPPALSFASMAYDAALDEMVLFGGEVLGSTPSDQTWFYNGTTWTDADISGPSARSATSMAYDAAADEMVLIGGLGPGDESLGDTWLLNSAGTWNGPYEPLAGGVYGASIAYDPVISDVVLYGGVYENGEAVENLTSTFNTSTGWTPQSPSGSPPPVAYASMDYDPVLGDAVLFGGVASGFSGGTWGYDGTNWYEEESSASPSPRAYGAMAFDPGTNRMVLYGGDDTTEPSTGTDYGDTWVYGSAGTITQTGATSDAIFTGAPYILTGGLSVSGNTGAVTFTQTTSSPTFSVEPGGLVYVTDVEPGSYTVSGTDSDAFGDTGTWTYTLSLIGSTLYVASGGTDNEACAAVDPCATVAQSLAVAESGPLNGQAVTIDVGPGTYSESGDSIDASLLASLAIDGAGDTQTTVTTSNPSGALLPSAGSVTISNLTISGAPQGILNAATLTLSDDTLSNDTVGLRNLGTANLVDDTFTQIGQDALLNSGGATVTDDTFAGDGAAVDTASGDSGGTTLTDDTLSNDTTGIDNNAATSIANSIIDSAPCLGSAPADGGYSVESDDSCSLSPGDGDLVDNSHIELGSLAANGSSGPATESIGPTSSALDVVPQASCSVPTDERGDPRPGETGQVDCDAGAYEIQSKANTQTISFTSTPPANNHVYGEYIPTASSTSGLTVKLNLDPRSQGCLFNDGIVYYNAVGTCLIDATQAGDASYLPAPEVQQAIEIFLVVQTVMFSTSPPSPAYVGGTYTPAASATSNDPVTFSIDTSSTGCGVSGGVVTFTSQGTCVVDADQAGGFGYAPAEAQQSFAISQLSQTVSFNSSVADALVGDTYRPAVSASSGLTPVISLQSGSTGCSLRSGTVHFTADGTCLLEVNQAGSLAYAPAPQADQSLTVTTDGLVAPLAVSSDGTHVWVANSGGNSVTELDASTGALVAVLHATNEKFDGPSAISSDGTDVWVANTGGNSVTELSASDGSLVRVLSGVRYKFDAPSAISSDGTDVWVANFNGNSVTELAAATGALVKVLMSAKDAFDGPSAVSADGTHVWVADEYGNSVTELDAGSGSFVRVIAAAADDVLGPDGISSDRTHVWVSNFESNSVTELTAANGALARVVTGDGLSQPENLDSDGTSVWVTTYNDSVTLLKAHTGALVAVLNDSTDPGYDFDVPVGVSTDGTHAWVTNDDGNSVTEMGARAGHLVRVISR